MILFGASGHAKVILNILELSGESVSFLVDGNPNVKKLNGYPVIHESQFDLAEEPLFISIGNNTIRKKLANKYSGNYGRAIHPKSILDSNVEVGEGTVVMAGAVINNSAIIGNHCIINTSANVDHDCVVGNFAHVSPNATLCGTVSVGEGTHIGAGATVAPNIKIGKWATIGAGSVIISDVPDFAIVVGNPGAIIKYNDEQR